ncbi:phosphoglucomutase (alpha-D-glucose-1,6-bisphosphate-dependent) [Catenulispora yoronensis]
MALHPRAGQPAEAADLVDVPRLIDAYYAEQPDPGIRDQRVAFGTSGHRGSSLRVSFNENHVLAASQAVCDYRRAQGIDGPLYLGRDTHALSEPAMMSTLEVFAANDVTVLIDDQDGYTPTPTVSHAILAHNRGRTTGLADGVVITPSHNPPDDGGYKYNGTDGGPAAEDVTAWIQERANALLAEGLRSVRRIPYARALAADTTVRHDYTDTYVGDLIEVVDLEAIRRSGVRIGVDPLGGASTAYWDRIGNRYGLDLTVVGAKVDPTFGFMTLDWDGKIRMDCSSPYAMASLITQRDHFDVACGNDADSDRHGIVTPDSGLMNPNHYLAVAIDFLCGNRPGWPPAAAIGKTLVTSTMVDKVVAAHGRPLYETPVGFKWFVAGLLDSTIAVGVEESAGASFLRKDGTVWSTDKDGLILDLLAAEIIAVTGQSPSRCYESLTERFGNPAYRRIDVPATPDQKAALGRLSADDVTATTLAGEPITARRTTAPGNGAAIGGLKVTTESGWFAARPSGTEDVYKIYGESLKGEEHLAEIHAEAERIVAESLNSA